MIEAVPFFNLDNYTVVSTRSVTLSRSFNREYTRIGQDDSYYYIMERDSSDNKKLYLNIVSKTDFSLTTQTIELVTETLARIQGRKNTCNNGIVSNGFIYWVSAADQKTFVRINIQTPADTIRLTSYMTGNINETTQPISRTAGLILGRNFLINGDYVYPVTPRGGRADANDLPIDSMALFKNGPLAVQSGTYYDTATYMYFTVGGVLYLPHLLTVNNLQNPVVKQENRTMRVEYTLTLTGGS